jgi:hypothetical protein
MHHIFIHIQIYFHTIPCIPYEDMKKAEGGLMYCIAESRNVSTGKKEPAERRRDGEREIAPANIGDGSMGAWEMGAWESGGGGWRVGK